MRFLILIFLLSLTVFAKNVLVLNSYSAVSKWTSGQSNSIINTLREDTNINIYVEFMNTKAFKPNMQIEKNLLNFYEHKYKDIKLDAVITTDDNAINFIVKNQNNPIFSKAKFFFSGVNNLNLANKLPKRKFAGVFEQKNPMGNLELAKKLNPKLKTIYFVGDNTITSSTIIKEYKNAYKNEKGINLVYLDYSNIEEVTTQLKKHDKNSILMLMVFAAFKKDGEHINSTLALKNLSKVYKKPMITHDSIYTELNGTNIIGGHCLDSASAGKIAANFLINYFKGNSLKNIGFNFTEGTKLYINEKNLNSFNIDIEDLDLKEPIIVNKNNSFYKLHSELINTLIAILVLSIIGAYIYIRNRQYEALDRLNKEIKYLNDNLEHKVSEQVQEIKKSTQLFKTIFNTVKNGLAIIDLDSNFLLVNDAYESIMGFSKEEFYKSSAIQITQEGFKEEFEKIVKAMKEKKVHFGYMKKEVRKDGMILDIMMDLSLMPDNESILVVAKDITEQKRKDEQLLQQSRLAQMGKMISMIAHQWRQPLGAIGSAIISMKLQLRSKKEVFWDEQRLSEYLKELDTRYDTINEYVQFLSTTIDDFRNFYKPNKEKEKVCITRPIQKALKIIEASLLNYNIKLQTNYQIDDEVLIYPNEVMQVILNILKNSEENFLEKKTENAMIEIITRKSRNSYIITISDNGGGIPKKLLPKIFDPYYSTKEETGTGLGLYMSKMIIEEHNAGKLFAKNTKDGVEFKIKFPIYSSNL